MIDKLDVLISGGKGDSNYSLLMYETLLRKFNSPDINRSLHQLGVRFVNSVKLLLEHLLNFRYVYTVQCTAYSVQTSFCFDEMYAL